MGRKKSPADASAEGLTGSQSVRLSLDLARMIAWICEIEGMKAHELLDPILRAPISARFERIKKRAEEIEKIKLKAQAEIEELRKKL